MKYRFQVSYRSANEPRALRTRGYVSTVRLYKRSCPACIDLEERSVRFSDGSVSFFTPPSRNFCGVPELGVKNRTCRRKKNIFAHPARIIDRLDGEQPDVTLTDANVICYFDRSTRKENNRNRNYTHEYGCTCR